MASITRRIRRNQVRQFMASKGVQNINKHLGYYWMLIQRGGKAQKEAKRFEARQAAHKSNERTVAAAGIRAGRLALHQKP
jgi:hypothetical protein